MYFCGAGRTPVLRTETRERPRAASRNRCGANSTANSNWRSHRRTRTERKVKRLTFCLTAHLTRQGIQIRRPQQVNVIPADCAVYALTVLPGCRDVIDVRVSAKAGLSLTSIARSESPPLREVLDAEYHD
ncbi:hypothetical protein EXIGLDRAFT_441595 [Exidia glandulosa HHB12029]|uniref:Uncharacterized protein n=1 Tax=Exidia glandulosa HHB12029 TaxID=1314781 RepID=A0A165KAY9_EXIGL|nr:hypothetical protein EXIGLDRAFT_441595 [Exidia glandulosa HHB12029]